MRFRAPIIAAVLLGLAITLVWLRREEPVSTVPETVSVPRAAEPGATTADGAPSDEARPSAPPALQERTTESATSVAREPLRSPLPGEAPTTPLIQLFEDQRALNRPAPAGIGQGFPRVQPQIAESERAFGVEPIDASWATGAEADALGKIAQINGLELLDLRIECRSTLCRLQMAQPGRQGTNSPDDVLDAIGLEPHWVMSLAGRAGSVNTVAYLWREGFAPPRPAVHEGSSDDEK